MATKRQVPGDTTATPEAVTVIKTTVNLPANVVDSLKKLAATRGITMGKAIADALELEALIQERRQQGGRVFVEDKDKSRTELWIR